MNKIAAIILAAGEASRFRAAAGEQGPQTKLVALHQGKALVRHVAEAALAAGLAPVIAVTGHARDNVVQALSGLDLQHLQNDAYATGMASSLKAGVEALPAHVGGFVVLLGDMPLVSAGLIRSLVDAYLADPLADAIVPLLDGERGNPVVLSQRMAPRIMQLSGDAGARKILQDPGLKIIEMPIVDEAARIDIDTPQALAALDKAHP
jgi:molybdenum cofactor cytidylyltransferase